MSQSVFRRIRERINLLRDLTQLPFRDLLDLVRGGNLVGTVRCWRSGHGDRQAS
jgi:hypothetical protein